MTHQQPSLSASTLVDPDRKVAQLRYVLSLVDEIAGEDGGRRDPDTALDEAARIGAAYRHALPIDRRRFDAFAAVTATWAAAGVEALLGCEGREPPPRAAAARLAGEIRTALKALAAISRPLL